MGKNTRKNYKEKVHLSGLLNVARINSLTILATAHDVEVNN